MKIADYQVLQRNAHQQASVELPNGDPIELSPGGPYTVAGAANVLVGDIWLLAGQSNMEGVGDLIDVEAPSPHVHSFQSREQWAIAEEPLHWLGESPRLVHFTLNGRDAVPDVPDPREMGRTKGAGLGVAFGKKLHQYTGCPVGLIPSAHGGTSMAQWDPALKHEGGASLYGAALARFREVGGHIAGILWYQGESDTDPASAQLYKERMTALVNAFRADFAQPDLPFCFVQIGRYATTPSPGLVDGWNQIREAQRTWAAATPHTSMVTAVDLEVDDPIHIGVHGLKRLGGRLAYSAAGNPSPTLAAAHANSDGTRVHIRYDNVRMGLRSAGRPCGFTVRDNAGNELSGIYKITLEGDAAVLHIDSNALRIGSNTRLWYGWGIDPYCNITDAADAAVPAFGPVPITR